MARRSASITTHGLNVEGGEDRGLGRSFSTRPSQGIRPPPMLAPPIADCDPPTAPCYAEISRARRASRIPVPPGAPIENINGQGITPLPLSTRQARFRRNWKGMKFSHSVSTISCTLPARRFSAEHGHRSRHRMWSAPVSVPPPEWSRILPAPTISRLPRAPQYLPSGASMTASASCNIRFQGNLGRPFPPCGDFAAEPPSFHHDIAEQLWGGA